MLTRNLGPAPFLKLSRHAVNFPYSHPGHLLSNACLGHHFELAGQKGLCGIQFAEAAALYQRLQDRQRLCGVAARLQGQCQMIGNARIVRLHVVGFLQGRDRAFEIRAVQLHGSQRVQIVC